MNRPALPAGILAADPGDDRPGRPLPDRRYRARSRPEALGERARASPPAFILEGWTPKPGEVKDIGEIRPGGTN